MGENLYRNYRRTLKRHLINALRKNLDYELSASGSHILKNVYETATICFEVINEDYEKYLRLCSEEICVDESSSIELRNKKDKLIDDIATIILKRVNVKRCVTFVTNEGGIRIDKIPLCANMIIYYLEGRKSPPGRRKIL